MSFLGWIKNGIKHTTGLQMPAFFPASRTTYDPTTSGLSATRVQGAIDEVNVKASDVVPKSTGGIFDGSVAVVETNQGTSMIESRMVLGNNIANGSAGSTFGTMYLYGSGAYYTKIQSGSPSANRVITLPNKDGTVALVGDLSVGHYLYKGELLHGTNTDILGHGVAQITMFNGLARIEFEVQIGTEHQGTNDIYSYGIDAGYFTSITGKQITPLAQGNFQYYLPTGSINNNLEGIAGVPTLNGSYAHLWLLARMYTTSGSVGQWPARLFASGSRIIGTVYGTYT